MKPWRFLPAAAWAAGIFWLSSQPVLPELPLAFPGSDKVLHAGAFGLLCVLCAFALAWPPPPRLWNAAIMATAYGVFDELHQRFVPGRTPDVLDLLADACGAALAVAIVRWLLVAREVR